jgi:hypothetical protein
MEDQTFEEWIEGFATGTFTQVELEELGSGAKQPTEIDVRNFVREIEFLRDLTLRMHLRLRELGDNDSPVQRFAALAIEGVRPDSDS